VHDVLDFVLIPLSVASSSLASASALAFTGVILQPKDSDLPVSIMADLVTITYRDRVAIITIDNPKKLGALTKDGFYQISKYLREIETHDEVFITVLTGRGRFFSAYAFLLNNRIHPQVDVFRTVAQMYRSIVTFLSDKTPGDMASRSPLRAIST